MMNRRVAVLVSSAAVLAVVSRLSPLPHNLSAMGAFMLLSGAAIAHPALRVLIPMAFLLVSDIALHIKTGYGYDRSLPFVYLSYVLIISLGHFVRPRRVLSSAMTGLGSGTIFFLLSNFGCWLMWIDTDGTPVYSQTLAGLTECYTLALPFVRGTLYGDVAFSVLFFGIFARLQSSITSDAADRASVPQES